MAQLIGMASDHAGFELKEALKPFLEKAGYKIKDFGTHSSESMDYPDVAHPLAVAVENKDVDFGIAMCGSGNGISMTLNKHQGIRAALCWTPELGALAKRHNNANILTMGGRVIGPGVARDIVDIFLTTKFEGGRHAARVAMITEMDK